MLNDGQTGRIMEDSKRIAQVSGGFQCLLECMRKEFPQPSETVALIMECMENKVMLIVGLGNNLYSDMSGMVEHNNRLKGE